MKRNWRTLECNETKSATYFFEDPSPAIVLLFHQLNFESLIQFKNIQHSRIIAERFMDKTLELTTIFQLDTFFDFLAL